MDEATTRDGLTALGSAALRERLREVRVSAFLGVPPTTQTAQACTDGQDPPPGDSDIADLDRLVQAAGRLYAASVTDQTRASYARRWAQFVTWCDRRELTSLPTTPEVFMLYLADQAGHDRSVSTLRGMAAAINRIHLEAGETPPGTGPSTRVFWRGLARAAPTRNARQITALRINGLRTICRTIDATGPDPVEIRDRAILGLFLAGATGTEIANARWEDLRQHGPVLTGTLRPNRQRPSTREITVVPSIQEQDEFGCSCPVAAVEAWRSHLLETGETPRGYLFPFLDVRCTTPKPLDSNTVKKVRRQRLATLGGRAEPAASIEQAMRLLGHRHPIDLRDKAMLTLGFAGAMRRGEVTELRWSDLTLTSDGIVCRLRRTKTDMEGRHQTQVGIPFGRSELTCPVTALLAWKARVEAQHGEAEPEGWVFTTAGRRGRAESLGTEPITRETLTRVVEARARQAGLSGHWGGRSLRAGFISTAADLDIPLEAIATQSRHKTLDTLTRYIRDTDPFRRNPAARVGL